MAADGGKPGFRAYLMKGSGERRRGARIMPKKTITWVLVADGAQARVLSNDGPGRGLKPAMDRGFESGRQHTREIVSDRQGRHPDRTGGGGGRHAMDPKTDPHRHMEHEFARSLAEVLEKEAINKRFDRLVLVAPPRMLGDLRAELAPHARAAVTAEVDKDLVHLADAEVARHLDEIIL